MGTAVKRIQSIPWREFEGSTRPALVDGDLVVSYAELAERVDARRTELGAGRKLIRIRFSRDVESVVSYLSALDAGHAAWLEAPGCELQASPTPIRPDVEISVRDGRAEIVESGDPGEHLHLDLAVLLSTSGSTGAPRLVRLSHSNVRANACAIAAYLRIGDGDRALTSLPLHYCFGLSVANSHLASGACLLLTEASVTDPGFWTLARDERATSFAGVPHTFDLLDRVGFDDMDLPDLRYITQAGGKLAPDRVRRYAGLGRRRGWSFYVMYGQTEATARMAYLPPELAAEEPQSIGIPIPGGSLELRDVDETDDPEVGELVYTGPNVMMGYAEEAADLERGHELAELRTGDLARRSAAGLYEIVGRRSRFVKPFGLRIDLGQLERVLAEHDIEAVCAGTDDRLAVAVVGDVDADHISSLVAERVGVPARLVEVACLSEIPRTSTGKPDYPAILAACRHGRDTDTDDIAAVLADAIGRPVCDDDSFAGLGGDSLSYVDASVGLEELLGELPPEWPEMTVAELSSLRSPEPDRKWSLRRIETDVAVRAGAISLVVASHMTDFWPAGGAHLLLAVAGFSFARFQLSSSDSPDRYRRWLRSIGRIAVPSAAWIALLALSVGGFSLGAVLLVNNIFGEAALTGARWHYWFIEALVQILLVALIVFSVPAIRRLERRWPFGFALGLTLLLFVPAALAVAMSSAPNTFFLTWVVAWIFALGWATHRARTLVQRLAVTGVATPSLIVFFDAPVRGGVVLAGVLLLLWLPSVRIPQALVRMVALVAAASLAIYLTHWQVFPELTSLVPTTVAFVLTMAAGIATWLVARGTLILTRRLQDGPSERAATAREVRATGVPAGSR
jgi:acyl-CoA synthetase (AMP-forming)/AMP-acid ligase II